MVIFQKKEVIFLVGNRKSETRNHRLLKYLTAFMIEEYGGEPVIEEDFGDYIADVFDRKEGIAYEIQSKVQPNTEKIKVNKALLHGEIRDVIFLRTQNFKINGITNTDLFKKLRFKIGGI